MLLSLLLHNRLMHDISVITGSFRELSEQFSSDPLETIDEEVAKFGVWSLTEVSSSPR